jgi:hypothetical protein
MLTIVTFKWSTPGYRATFGPEHVRTLQRMVARHYHEPFRFVCFNDDPRGIEDVAQPLWRDYAAVPNPTGGGRPSCYRRLKLFDPAMASILGDRFVMLDLDVVLCGDVTPLWQRTEDIVLWKSPTGEWPYNGAMLLASPGVRPSVWGDFDPEESPRETTALGYRGSDQAWISHKLGWDEATWGEPDGVYYYPKLPSRDALPPNARIVFTTGGSAPWKIRLRHAWIREHYR